MITDKYGRVAGSIDLATLADMYAQATDDELKAHYRQVAAENGLDLEQATEPPAAEAEPAPSGPEEPEQPEEADYEALKAHAEQLGIKVDGRWGADRLRAEIEAEEGSD